MRLIVSERGLLLLLILLIAMPAFLFLTKKFRADPLEQAIRQYVGENSLDCGTIEEDEEPNTRAIAGCVGIARKNGRAFQVRRNTIMHADDFPSGLDVHWTTAIAGLPDGTTRTFYIERKRWRGVLIITSHRPKKKYKWTLDFDDVPDHQVNIQ